MTSLVPFAFLLIISINSVVCRHSIQVANEPFTPRPETVSHEYLKLLPIDCWIRCLDFLLKSHGLEIRYIRLLSKRHRDNYDVFLSHQMRKLKNWNGSQISSGEIPQTFIAFRSLCVQCMAYTFDDLLDMHCNQRRGIVYGINIVTGLPFLSLHLRHRDGHEISILCVFDDLDNGRFRSWVLYDQRVSTLCNHWFQITDLFALLRGSTIEVMTSWRRMDYFRIKYREEYFNYKTCNRCVAVLIPLVLLALSLSAVFAALK